MTNHYSYRVTWSQEDDEFVATCLELPSLSWLAPTPDEAMRGLEALVVEVVEDLRSSGEPVPEPLASRHYSGRLNVRLSEDLHRRLAMGAAAESMSLNQYLVRHLSAIA